MLDNSRHPHFIGVGGSGLSALASLALALGLKASGSDSSDSAVIQALREEGADVHIGHRKDNLADTVDTVIYSEAIDKTTNPEYLAAQDRGIILMSYFEALGHISRQKKTIVVTGTHGKTTTTAMLGQALIAAGKDPLVIVGSRVPAFGKRRSGSNLNFGGGKWFVVEACEYRRSFLYLSPFGMVLLNCEAEHLDYYKDETDYVRAFKELVAKIPPEGFLVYNKDDANAVAVSESCRGKKIPVGMADAKDLGLVLKVPGSFNQLNAAEAYTAALETGADPFAVQEALEAFGGTTRRMETKGEKEGVLVMDDYGHHPTEVRATLGALRERYPERRLICVFQPHQYSRTRKLLEEFKTAFMDAKGKPLADLVIIPNIYEARDSQEDKAAISAESFAATLRGVGIKALWGENEEKTLSLMKEEAKSGDLLLTMGAGDVYKLGDKYLT